MIKKSTLLTLVLASLFNLSIKAQSVTNVQSHQEGTSVVVNYTLQSEGETTVSLWVSENAGRTFKGPLKNVTGDVGDKVLAGNKAIVWNVLIEQDMLNSESVVFKVIGKQPFGKMFDNRDGHQYKTTQIGNQTWITENLAYNAGGNTWAYANDEANIKKYGYLYDWETAQKACPAGWHLPNKQEFDSLLFTIGGQGKTAFKALQVQSNSSFASVMGGYKDESGFFSNGTSAYYWSNTASNDNSSWYLLLNGASVYASITNNYSRQSGFSVRCLKDK